MKVTECVMCLLSLSVVVTSVILTGAIIHPSDGTIHWKGQDWILHSGHSAPGNNYWDDTGNGVWVDDQNRLHLTIKNSDGVWKCTEVSSQRKYLYGTFTWTVASPVYTFDKNSVMGLFTYSDDNNELDIEATRWGDDNGDQLWYSVQPSFGEGYAVSSGSGRTKYRLDWQPDYVRFTSWASDGTVIGDYTYTDVSGIPKQPASVIMNLWLNYAPPSDGKDIELIISDFAVTKT